MENKTKLTTVKILKDLYGEFKYIAYQTNFTLQRLTNRTLDRYVNDDAYRKEMNEYTALYKSGSRF